MGEQRVRVARPLVGALRRRFHRQPVEAPQRELGVALVVAQAAARRGQGLRGLGRLRALVPVQRAPQGAQLFQLAVDGRGAVRPDAVRERQGARAKVIHGNQSTGRTGFAPQAMRQRAPAWTTPLSGTGVTCQLLP
jgi:hypothetical protein